MFILLKPTILILTLIYVRPLEYQSYGDFTRPQLTQIVQMVQQTLKSESPNKAKTISQKLNEEMDPTWYVIYMDKTNNFDSIMVVYGYAFKNHWMWLSNFVQGKSIVLWKDFNCGEYVTGAEKDYNTNKLTDPSTFVFDNNALEIQGFTRLQYFSEVSSEYLSQTWKLVFDITTALNDNQNAYAYSGFGVQIPVQDIVIPQFSYCICKKKEAYDTLFMFQVKVKDFKDEVAARNFIILMRTR